VVRTGDATRVRHAQGIEVNAADVLVGDLNDKHGVMEEKESTYNGRSCCIRKCLSIPQTLRFLCIGLDHEKPQQCSRLTEMRRFFEERPIPRDTGTVRESSATSMDESGGNGVESDIEVGRRVGAYRAEIALEMLKMSVFREIMVEEKGKAMTGLGWFI